MCTFTDSGLILPIDMVSQKTSCFAIMFEIRLASSRHRDIRVPQASTLHSKFLLLLGRQLIVPRSFGKQDQGIRQKMDHHPAGIQCRFSLLGFAGRFIRDHVSQCQLAGFGKQIAVGLRFTFWNVQV